MKKILLAVLVIVIILLLPLLLKEKGNRFVIGPKLNETTYTEVSFVNKHDGVLISGMLFKPKNIDSFPMAVIIHGSGPSMRDNAWYLSIAKHLQDNGIGVLLPDKRGCEKSEGKWIGVTFDTLATDTESAINFIRNESKINYTEIGIIGMSQGGWITPIVAARERSLAYVVNMSGSMTSTDEQLLHEEYYNIAPYTYNVIAKLISPITTNNLKKKESLAPLMGFDPVPYWKKTSVPVFIAYGENDTNCPIKKSVERLDDENLNHFKYKIYPAGGHGILDAHTNEVNSNFLEDLTKFIFEKNITM
jgi:dipeptidyl aminopeptidase/acylaminoacyl peptidase